MALRLEIAGVGLEVESEGPTAELVASLASLYPEKTAPIALALRLLPRLEGNEGKAGCVEVVEGDEVERIEMPHSLSGRIDLNRRIGTLHLDSGENAIRSALRFAFSVVALRSNVLWLHSLGVLQEGRAFLFAGPSGSGKSTLGRTVNRDVLLADESVAIRWEAGTPVVCSTPFQSAGQVPPPHREGALAAIHLLARGTSTTIRWIDPGQGLARIWRCVFSLERSLAAQERALAMVGELVETFGVRELAFRLEPDVLHKAMTHGPKIAQLAS